MRISMKPGLEGEKSGFLSLAVMNIDCQPPPSLQLTIGSSVKKD
jgi:hypothetical protein